MLQVLVASLLRVGGRDGERLNICEQIHDTSLEGVQLAAHGGGARLEQDGAEGPEEAAALGRGEAAEEVVVGEWGELGGGFEEADEEAAVGAARREGVVVVGARAEAVHEDVCVRGVAQHRPGLQDLLNIEYY